MGSMTKRRHFDGMDARALLQAIGECRRACIKAHTKAPIHDPIYDAVSSLVAAIDDAAAVLTGDRQHFWLRPLGGPDDGKPPPH